MAAATRSAAANAMPIMPVRMWSPPEVLNFTQTRDRQIDARSRTRRYKERLTPGEEWVQMQPQMDAILDAPRLTVANRASPAEGRAEALQLRSGGTFLARERPSIY